MTTQTIQDQIKSHLATEGYEYIADLMSLLLANHTANDVEAAVTEVDADLLGYFDEAVISRNKYLATKSADEAKANQVKADWETSVHGRFAAGEFAVRQLRKSYLAGGSSRKYSNMNPTGLNSGKSVEKTEIISVVEIDGKLYKTSEFLDLATFTRHQGCYSTAPNVYSSNLDQDWV